MEDFPDFASLRENQWIYIHFQAKSMQNHWYPCQRGKIWKIFHISPIFELNFLRIFKKIDVLKRETSPLELEYYIYLRNIPLSRSSARFRFFYWLDFDPETNLRNLLIMKNGTKAWKLIFNSVNKTAKLSNHNCRICYLSWANEILKFW